MAACNIIYSEHEKDRKRKQDNSRDHRDNLWLLQQRIHRWQCLWDPRVSAFSNDLWVYLNFWRWKYYCAWPMSTLRQGEIRRYRPHNRAIMGFLVYSEEYGVYLGACFGLGFWSKLDSVGQDNAPLFSSRSEADDFIRGWDDEPIDQIKVIEIRDTISWDSATMQECIKAGLPAWWFSPFPHTHRQTLLLFKDVPMTNFVC